MKIIQAGEYLAPELGIRRPVTAKTVKEPPSAIWHYRELECGHFVTPESQERYRIWRPKLGLAWCEYHSKWIAYKKYPKALEISQEALF